MTLIKHQDSNTGNGSGIAGICLNDFRHSLIECGIEKGTFVFDSMDKLAAVAAGVDGDNQGWYLLLDTTATFDIVNEVGGVREFDLNADNEDGMLVSGGGAAGFCEIATTVSDRYDIFFETRVKLIDASACELFFGIADVSQVAVISATDDTMDTGRDYIGFHWKPTANTLNIVLNENGATETELALASSYALADDTWVKLSVRYWTEGADSGKLQFAIDGEVVQTYRDLTGANGANLAASVAYDTPMACVLNVKSQGGATEAEVDHIAFGCKGENT